MAGAKLEGHQKKKATKAEVKDGQKVYELQLRMVKYEQMKMLLEHRVVTPAQMAKYLEMSPEDQKLFFQNKMTAPQLVSFYDDKKGERIKKRIFRSKHRLYYVDESKKDGSFTMISILSKRHLFKADEVITAVSVSFEDAANVYKRTQKKSNKKVH